MTVHLSLNFSHFPTDQRIRAESVSQSLPLESMKPFLLGAQLGDQVCFPIDQLDAVVVKREWHIHDGRTTFYVWLAPYGQAAAQNDSDGS